MPDFKAHLRQQLGFITTSTKEVMRGTFGEAVRIATAIRVIVHNTQQSTSLLEHLACPSPLMLATGGPIREDALFASGVLYRMVFDAAGPHMEPQFGRCHGYRTIPFSTWWNEIVEIVDPLRLTRRDIILAAANKDGGAHVDDLLPESYERIKRGVWQTADGSSHPQLKNQIAVDIVQIGFEVQNSPGVLELLN